jgi:hypothetical protein
VHLLRHGDGLRCNFEFVGHELMNDFTAGLCILGWIVMIMLALGSGKDGTGAAPEPRTLKK